MGIVSSQPGLPKKDPDRWKTARNLSVNYEQNHKNCCHQL